MTRPKPSNLASLLRGFFVDYLPRQRALSPHTLASYRDSIKLLLQFFAGKNGDTTKLTIEHLTVTRITAFLQHLETARRNCTCTRNVRLSAVHSFFRYLGGECPEHLAQAQRILSVPFKELPRVKSNIWIWTRSSRFWQPSILKRPQGHGILHC